MTTLINKMNEIRSKKDDEGFTLVELLVVVVILVALAAIAVPIFLNQANRAKEGAAVNSVATVAGVISNGFAIGQTPAVAAGVVSYDSDAGDQDVELGTAVIVDVTNGGAAPDVTAAAVPAAPNWCVEQATGSNRANSGYAVLYAGDSKPTLQAAGCAAL